MSGHSKWATTKHKKAIIDSRRAKSFVKFVKAIEVAARTGGADMVGAALAGEDRVGERVVGDVTLDLLADPAVVGVRAFLGEELAVDPQQVGEMRAR